MLHLLKIEWMKVKNYRTFWVLSILYLVSIFGANYIAYRIQQSIYEQEKMKVAASLFIGDTPYSFPNNWQMAGWVSGLLLFMPGLLILISITNEYSYKTHRQNIIDGWSRTQFISVKLLLAVVVAAVSTIIVFLAALLFGVVDGSKPVSFVNIEFVGYYFIQSLSYSCAALLIGVLLKRSGIAIGIYFLYTTFIENSIAGLLNKFANYSGRFLPLETTDNLIPFPILRSMQKQFIPEVSVTILLCLSAVYLFAYYYISRKKFESSDL